MQKFILCAYFFLSFLLSFLIPAGASSVFGADLTIAVLKSDGNFPLDDILTGFKTKIRQNNYGLRIIFIDLEGDRHKFTGQLAQIKPDVILCVGVKALEQAAVVKNIPKLYSFVTYEHACRWSTRNDIFGVSLDAAPLIQFRIIRQALPESGRIGVFYDPGNNQLLIEEVKRAAAILNFSVVALPVSAIRDIPVAFQKLENNVDLLWTIYDRTVYTRETTKYILMQSLARKIPVVGLSPHFAKAGALLAIYGDYQDMGQQLAVQMMAIVRGEKITRNARPQKVKIAINEKVGRYMSISFPSPFMKTVHQIY